MKFFKKFFEEKEGPAPQAFSIEGVPEARLTSEPDDAELAAQALLELMSKVASKKVTPSPSHGGRGEPDATEASGQEDLPSQDVHGSAYYHALAKRIREAHRMSTLRATRFVATCEQELRKKRLPFHGPGSLGLLEAELYKRIDIVEREGGELKQRWQRCLAEVTVRLMKNEE